MKQLETPECQECATFDAETKKLLLQVIGPDEIVLIVALLAASIKLQDMIAKQSPDNLQVRARSKRDSDFAAAVTGKLLVGLEPLSRELLLKQILKQHGIMLNLKHGACPHEKEEVTGC